MFVQGMGILKPIHVCILTLSTIPNTHIKIVQHSLLQKKKKKAYNKEIFFFVMILEKKGKRWSEGWVVLMADGYGEKRVAWEEKRKRKKKKERKEMV